MDTILLVDDESEVVATAREILEKHGFRVLTALNADAAVQVASLHEEPIHLLLTDVVMPGTSGQALAQQLTVQRPEMKVLYMSGFVLLEPSRHGHRARPQAAKRLR